MATGNGLRWFCTSRLQTPGRRKRAGTYLSSVLRSGLQRDRARQVQRDLTTHDAVSNEMFEISVKRFSVGTSNVNGNACSPSFLIRRSCRRVRVFSSGGGGNAWTLATNKSFRNVNPRTSKSSRPYRNAQVSVTNTEGETEHKGCVSVGAETGFQAPNETQSGGPHNFTPMEPLVFVQRPRVNLKSVYNPYVSFLKQ